MKYNMMRSIPVMIVLLLISISSFGQKENKIIEFKEKMWSSDNADFLLSEVPEHYKNESAVFLAKSMEYEVKKQLLRSVLKESFYIHKRIKLLDEAAVNEFSEISFKPSKFISVSNQVEVIVGVKIIKPNGEEREIDPSLAVEMEAKSGNLKEVYKKLAIPGLEPGDILDYFHCIEVDFALRNFDRRLYVLAESYPIVKQRVDITLAKDCMMNLKSLNGAPELKSNFLNTKNVYSLVMEHVDKIDHEQKWFYPYRSVPTLNFQAYHPYIYTSSLQAYFKGEMGKIQTTISEEKLLGYAGQIAGDKYSHLMPLYGQMKNHVSAKLSREQDKEKIVQEAFNFLREEKFVDNLEDHLLSRRSYKFGLSNLEFTFIMLRFLKKMKISHDLVIVTPRTISDIEDLVLEEDANIMIRVNTPNPFFMGRFDRAAQYNDIDYVFQGINAYAVNVSEPKKQRTLQKITIPSQSAKDNNEFITLGVEINPENPDQIDFKRTVVYKGLSKFTEFENVITPYEYLDEYSKSGKAYVKRKPNVDFQQKVAARKEQDDSDREKLIKNQLEYQFDSKLISYDNFILKHTGIWPQNPDLQFSDEFTIEGLSIVNGNDIIVEAGKLINKQVALEKSDLDRKYDVYSPSPRSFSHNISITVPDGYVVKGLEKLNYSVSNKTGSFNSKATLIDGKIIITTEKTYNQFITKAEDWPEMVAFLEAAYDFTQQKILLTKEVLSDL